MLDQDHSATADAEIDIAVRRDMQILTNPRRYRHLTFCCDFHSITVARITAFVKPPMPPLRIRRASDDSVQCLVGEPSFLLLSVHAPEEWQNMARTRSLVNRSRRPLSLTDLFLLAVDDSGRRERLTISFRSFPYSLHSPTLHLTRKGKASEARPFTCRVQVVVGPRFHSRHRLASECGRVAIV